MGFSLSGLLQQYLGGNASSAETPEHFEQAAQGASPSVVSQGLSAMFHSDQTPPFAQMASHLFGQANPSQQAGMLNQLTAGMGPNAISSLLRGAGGAALAGVIGNAATSNNTITPEQASQLTPDQVQQIAAHAEQNSPGIVEHMSNFYAQHSGLIKTLGGAALTIALAKMAEAQKSS